MLQSYLKIVLSLSDEIHFSSRSCRLLVGARPFWNRRCTSLTLSPPGLTQRDYLDRCQVAEDRYTLYLGCCTYSSCAMGELFVSPCQLNDIVARRPEQGIEVLL